MFNLQFNTVDLERVAKRLNGAMDQVPFALSLALNQAVRETKQYLVEETWPQHVTQRNARFINSALDYTTCHKDLLRVEIFDKLGRAHLELHDKGGTKIGKRRLAIPPQGSVTRTSSGVRKSQRPAAIIASTPRRALRITATGIFVGKGGRLHLKFSLLPNAKQPADVPFAEDFRFMMTKLVAASFPAKMAKAMSTRRP
jgi:hypothetical protein